MEAFCQSFFCDNLSDQWYKVDLLRQCSFQHFIFCTLANKFSSLNLRGARASKIYLFTSLAPDFAEKSVTLRKKPPGRLSRLGLRLIANTSVNSTQMKYFDEKSYFNQCDRNRKLFLLLSFIVQDRAVWNFVSQFVSKN